MDYSKFIYIERNTHMPRVYTHISVPKHNVDIFQKFQMLLI